MKGDKRSYLNRDECEEHPLQVDLYGIKARGKPSPSNEPIPRTWGEVSDHVNQSMMRLAVEPLALVADVLSSARSIIRGVAALPAALGARITMSQQKAVDLEEDHQRKVENRKVPLQLPLGKAIDCIREEGVDLTVKALPRGHIIVSAIRPEHKRLPCDLAQDALAEFNGEPALLPENSNVADTSS